MKDLINNLISWIKNYFKTNSFAKGVVIGMSGGRDSLVCAKLCCEALGANNVLGVIIPNGQMAEILDAIHACRFLGIKYTVVNINYSYNNLVDEINKSLSDAGNFILSEKSLQHMEPRIRMTTLYAISATVDYLVANTLNLTKKLIGHATKWGDNVGDFAPLLNLTKTEIIQIGEHYMLPGFLMHHKNSSDLTENTDTYDIEINYLEMDQFIRYGKSFNRDLIKRVLHYYTRNKHKHLETATFVPNLPMFLKEN